MTLFIFGINERVTSDKQYWFQQKYKYNKGHINRKKWSQSRGWLTTLFISSPTIRPLSVFVFILLHSFSTLQQERGTKNCTIHLPELELEPSRSIVLYLHHYTTPTNKFNPTVFFSLFTCKRIQPENGFFVYRHDKYVHCKNFIGNRGLIIFIDEGANVICVQLDYLFISFIHVLGEIPNGLIYSGYQRRLYMLMSDLTHRSLACKAHLNILIENALYKFITITICS